MTWAGEGQVFIPLRRKPTSRSMCFFPESYHGGEKKAPWQNYELAFIAFLDSDPRILGYQPASFPHTGRHHSAFSKSQRSTESRESEDICQSPSLPTPPAQPGIRWKVQWYIYPGLYNQCTISQGISKTIWIFILFKYKIVKVKKAGGGDS